MSPTHEAESSALTVSGTPKRSSPGKRWSASCWWDSSLSPRNHIDASTGTSQSHTSIRQGPLDRRQRIPGGSRHQQDGEQRTLTTSEFSGRPRRTPRPHHRRSEPSALTGVGERFGRPDHFANLHPPVRPEHPQALYRPDLRILPHQATLNAVDCCSLPKRSPPRKPCSGVCQWDSSLRPRDPYPRHHDGAQSYTSMRHDPHDRRLPTSGRQPASARRGAANPDHFDVLWEVKPDRSPTSPQVRTLASARCR